MTRPSAGSLVSVPFSLSSTSSHHSKQSGSSPEAHQDHHASLSSGTSTTEEGLLIEEDDCALCRNYTEEDGLMLQCAACRSQGHPSCLQMSDALANACRAYDWHCIECKECNVCSVNDDDLILCDRCDRGFHGTCLTPKILSPPPEDSDWVCPSCQAASPLRKLPSRPKQTQTQTTALARSRRATLPANSSSSLLMMSHNKQQQQQQQQKQKDDGAPSIRVTLQRPPQRPASYAQSDHLHPSSSTSLRGQQQQELDDPPYSRRASLPNLAHNNSKGKGRLLDAHHHHQQQQQHDMGLSPEPRPDEPPPKPYGGLLSSKQSAPGHRQPVLDDRRMWAQARMTADNKLAAAVAKAPSLPPQAFASTSAASSSTSLPPFSADQQLNSAASHPSGNRHVTRELNRLATDLVSEEPLHKRARLSLASQPPPPPSSFSSNFLSQSMPAGIDGASPAAAAGPSTGTPAATPGTPNSPFLHFLAEGKYSNVQRISFAGYLIETWYQAPYPEEFARVPEGTLHICEWCLNYMSSDFQAKRHRTKCKMRHPPGDEIYRDGPISVFEVDGRKSKIYCQNLCLLSKMFLDHKTLYYDVDPFLFYVLCHRDEKGYSFVGYFSKEKRNPNNNLSCITTLPVRQRKGMGQFLIDFSYLLSRKEGRIGAPEKPLSDLGLVSYRNYWTLQIYRYLLEHEDQDVDIGDISQATAIIPDEVYYVLKSEHLIQSGAARNNSSSGSRPSTPGTPFSPAPAPSAPPKAPLVTKKRRYPYYPKAELAVPEPGTYHITPDYARMRAVVEKADAKDYLKLKPENLRWTPLYFDPALPPDEGRTARIRTTNNKNIEPERVPRGSLPQPPQHLPTMMNSVDPALMDPELRALPGPGRAAPSDSSKQQQPPQGSADGITPSSSAEAEGEAGSAESA